MQISSTSPSRALGALAVALVCCSKGPSNAAPAPSTSVETAASVAGDSASAAPASAQAALPSAAPLDLAAASAAPSASAVAQRPRHIDLPPAPNGILPAGVADALVPVGGTPRVQVVEPGAEPRARLAYDLATGTTDHVGMSLSMKVGIATEGQQLAPQTIPRISMTFDVATLDKTADGNWRVDLKLAKLGLDGPAEQDQIVAALRPQLHAIEGMRVSSTVSPTGEMADFKAEASPSTNAPQAMLDGVSQSLHALVIPLPAEPIGLGGKWEVVSRVPSAGADLVQIATYSLKSRSGSKASLGTSVKQLAANAELHPPNQPRIHGRVVALKSHADGTTNIDLKSPAPQSGSMHLASTMDVEASEGGGAAQRTSISSDMRLDFSKPTAAAAATGGPKAP